MAAPDRPSTATRPPGTGPTERDKQSLPELGRELVDLTVAYAKQETVDPLRTLGRRVGLGVLGAAIASVGLVFLLVGVLRLVQVELAFGGTMSWVPYLVALVVAGAVAGFALTQIGRGRGR